MWGSPSRNYYPVRRKLKEAFDDPATACVSVLCSPKIQMVGMARSVGGRARQPILDLPKRQRLRGLQKVKSASYGLYGKDMINGQS
jgi:hypothetical protein